MARVRLMDAPEDYRRLGVAPGTVQPREDRRRSEIGVGNWEWWYFDAVLDDGTHVVVQFFTKGLGVPDDGLDHPSATVKLTLPDGTFLERRDDRPVEETSWGAEGADDAEGADVRIGPHVFSGDLDTYRIKVELIDGVGVDLQVTSWARAFRPGTAYFAFDGRAAGGIDYFTWLCAVPRAEVTGTVTIDGITATVQGAGYHDHQWGTTNYLTLWNHWLWARQAWDDYSILLFDLVSSSYHGFERFPVCFVQDAAGDPILENTRGAIGFELRESRLDAEDEAGPVSVHYVFERGDTRVEYTLEADEVLDSIDIYAQSPQEARDGFDAMDMHPAFTRYSGTGTLKVTRGGVTEERSAPLAYEFVHPGAAPYAERA